MLTRNAAVGFWWDRRLMIAKWHCPTRKWRYQDRIAAQLALANTRRVDSSRRPESERRLCRRQLHRGWHLTPESRRRKRRAA